MSSVGYWALWVLAAIGAVSLVLLVGGAIADYRSFDRTSGGYDPPYTGWTGTPIDWSEADVSSDGFRRSGHVLDYRLDCTTGMITFEVYGIGFDFRTISDRAIAVHKPREACAAQGFEPEF